MIFPILITQSNRPKGQDRSVLFGKSERPDGVYNEIATFYRRSGATMPFQFGEHFEGYDDVGFARRKKQERRFRELSFLFRTAPDFETKLFAALELLTRTANT